MSYIKIKSPISRNLTSGIKFSVKDAPTMYYDNNTSNAIQTYDFYALDSNNVNDVIMHLDLRDATKSVKPPNPNYSDYYLYSSQNVKPYAPTTITSQEEAGDSLYNGTTNMIAIKKTDIINFGTEIGNGFTMSMWIKVSKNNPNYIEWYSGSNSGYSIAKTVQSHLVGTVSTSNNMAFGIIMNRGAEGNRDLQIKNNTVFYIRSQDSKYTTGFIKKSIMNDEWTNLTWVADYVDNKLIYKIFINGQKVQYYPINEEITSSSTWATLDNGLGFGLWSKTDSDAGSEFIPVLGSYSSLDYNSNQTNSHGKFQLSTFTLYRKPLTDFQVFSDYKYYKERYITT